MRCASELFLLLRLRCSYGESTTIGAEGLSGAIPERIILHRLRFQAKSDKIDKSSAPVLDFTIQMIKGNPEYLVYVKFGP